MLSQKQLWWLTIGLVVTLWELSSATRRTMFALDSAYGYPRRRGLIEVLPRSWRSARRMGACVVAAVAIVRFGPLLTGDLRRPARRGLVPGPMGPCRAVLGLALAWSCGTAPATRQPVPWVSFGTGLVLLAWM